MKNVNNFQIAKVSPRMLLSICLIFCHFQPGVACEGVVYKKKRATIFTKNLILDFWEGSEYASGRVLGTIEIKRKVGTK